MPNLNVDGRGVALAAVEAPSSEIQVAIEQGFLTLAVRNAPLADVLRAIGTESGFKVSVKRDVDTLLTRSFARVPLDEAIGRLIGDTSAVMIYVRSRDEAVPQTLAEIVLYGAPGTGVTSGKQTPAARQSPQVALEQSIFGDLAQQDPAARARAIRRLDREKEAAAVGVLVRVLAEDDDTAVRMEAVDTLGKLAVKPGAEQSAAALAKVLADEESSIRLRAVRALSKVSGSGAVEAVAETLEGDPDARVRRMAAWTLGKTRTERARSALEVAAESDSEAAVRREADSILQHWDD